MKTSLKNGKNTEAQNQSENNQIIPPDIELYSKIIEELEKRTVEVPFKYCHRLIKDYAVDIKLGKAIVTPNDAFVVL